MSSLIVPKQIDLGGAQRVPDDVIKSLIPQSEFVRDENVVLPIEDLPEMALWRILATPVRQRIRTKSGILLAEETKHGQNWTHQMYKIAYVGPYVWSGKAYEAYDIPEAMRPKVNEIWLLYPKHPERFIFDDVEYVMLTDDALRGRVKPGTEHRYSFSGMST